ncbi:DUF3592 domain-containing protein [Actinomadura sp. K4S16]|uniref:DUF3592 domain-containing protein n=1 Tax=Actinomadura sp. K4S16 TaxID=1316147 RepID=UPI0011ECACA2|nr:DUF3592 domain-containing protein [Actinomadura sp. K4S16]
MSFWLLALLALAFGVAFVVGGIQRYRSGREFMASAQRVPGVVAGIHRVERSDSYEFFPVLRFRTMEGAEIETVGQTRGGSFELNRLKGRPVAVLYDPRNPREARMDTSSGRALSGSVGMVAAGCVFAVLGLVMLFVAAT